MEPKVYTIVVRTRSLSLLHSDVHYSLDDALSTATKKLRDALPEDRKNEHIQLFLHDALTTAQIIQKFYGEDAALVQLPLSDVGKDAEQPKVTSENNTVTAAENKSIPEMLEDAVTTKNNLLKKLVESKDLALLRASKKHLSEAEFKYIKGQISA